MSKRQIVKIKSSKDGYDIIAKKYKKYHKHLDSFDNGTWQKFLPRNVENKTILDIGSGDGRIYKYIQSFFPQKTSNPHFFYIALDISKEILKEHPSGKNILKKESDLNGSWKIDDVSIDILLGFFVIEHLENLKNFAFEVNRVLKVGGITIFGYFLQRRSVVFKDKDGEFKIQRNNWHIQEIVDYLEYEFLKVSLFEVVENDGNLLGYHILCEKN